MVIATNGFCRSAAGSYKPPTPTSVSPSRTPSSNPVASVSSATNPAAATSTSGTNKNSVPFSAAAFFAVALPVISLGLF